MPGPTANDTATLTLLLLLPAACGGSTAATAPTPQQPPPGMVWIPPGTFTMGSQTGDADAPRHQVTLAGFWIDVHEVTNREFARFVAATGYVTEAERTPTAAELPGVPDELRVPGALVFRRPEAADVDLAEFWRWWQFVPGACWRHPEGPGSSIADRQDHPVVQVSWNDAAAYARWANKRLPTEAEWERAARGGLEGARFCWGGDQTPDGRWVTNIWQGDFPRRNDATDGYLTTAPVGTFPRNGFGLHDMSGNVWEWCQDHYRPDGYGGGAPRKDPRGPASGFDPMEPGVDKRVMRGGSFLCSDVYCLGYLPGTRMKSTPDTALCHTGFRCVRDP